jgi:hypothetical protein
LHEEGRPNDVLVRIEAKKSATFRDLDVYLRDTLNLDGHLSTFRIATGQARFGIPQEVNICGGEYGSDEYAEMDGSKKSTTRLSTLFEVGSKARWEFDIGNPTRMLLKICELTTAQTPFAPGHLIREVADAGDAQEPTPTVPAGQITFDEAFPSWWLAMKASFSNRSGSSSDVEVVGGGACASEVIPGFLWLGGCHDARDSAWLDRTGITHILCCADSRAGLGAQACAEAGRQYMELGAEDVPGYDILGLHFDGARAFLRAARAGSEPAGECGGGGGGSGGGGGEGGEGGVGGEGDGGGRSRVLVHCYGGVNRSAAIVVGFLMAHGPTGSCALAAVSSASSLQEKSSLVQSVSTAGGGGSGGSGAADSDGSHVDTGSGGGGIGGERGRSDGEGCLAMSLAAAAKQVLRVRPFVLDNVPFVHGLARLDRRLGVDLEPAAGAAAAAAAAAAASPRVSPQQQTLPGHGQCV